MKLAFNGKGHYADLDKGYELYVKRAKTDKYFDRKTYNRVIKAYCRMLAKRLLDEGIVDLPKGMGAIATATITRKPQYRGKEFVGYGAKDWSTGQYDGKLKAFGVVYMPSRLRNNNLRCLGFVANRRLFKTLKQLHESGLCNWQPIEYKDDMI